MLQGDIASVARTVPDLLARRAAATPSSVAFHIKESALHGWRPISWEEHHAVVCRMTHALHRRRLRRGDRIGILAPTSVRWEIAQMGALAQGAVVAGIDPNYPDDQLSEIVQEVRPAALFVQDEETLARLPGAVWQELKFVCLLYGRSSQRSLDATSFDALMAGADSSLDATESGGLLQ